MRSTYVNILWGVALILGGGLFLAQNLGYFDRFSPQFWMAAFAGASLLFFASYFLSGIRHWGWLFPASMSAALALTIGLSEAGFTDAAIGAPILASIALPFVVAFALNPRQHWWALIPAWVMAVLTLIVLATARLPGEFIAALVLFGIALPFLVVYLVDRSRWWALIPAWVMAMLTLLVLATSRVSGEVIAALVLFGIALPFLVVYLIDRSRWWALIPAFTLSAVGLIPLLVNHVGGQVMGALVLLMLALPFLAVFLWSQRNWWWLIPAGILGSIGLSLLLSSIEVFGTYWNTLIGALMFLGWAATFGLLWLRRESQPTEWAKYPALIMLAAALVTMVLGSGIQQYWPLALIAVGALVLLNNLRARQSV